MKTQNNPDWRIFGCQTRIFQGDLNIVQGFCEVQEVENPPDLLISHSLGVLPETLVFGPFGDFSLSGTSPSGYDP